MKLGADPEIFLQDAHGAFISAIGKIGGSKEFPRPLEELGNGFAVQEDNVALEYNIPASSSEQELVNNINAAMSYLQREVQQMGLAFSRSSAAFYPKKQLADPRALVFGCEPDYNAWTSGVNPKPKAPDPTLRSCGGHVHVGVKVKDIERAVRRMDLCLGVPASKMDDGMLRKQLYGKWGAYRPKPYGFEYRVLSNFWVFDDKYIRWVWKATEQALSMVDHDIESDERLIFEAINENNPRAADELIEKYALQVV